MVKDAAKIIPYEDVGSRISQIHKKKKVLVGGCYDIIHYGHYAFLSKAKASGDYLIIALESDKYILKHKKRKPVHSQKQRAEILAAFSIVDLVITLPYMSSDIKYDNLVQVVNPQIIAVTKEDPQIEKKKKQAKEIGGKLQIVMPLLGDFSTQKIIQALI